MTFHFIASTGRTATTWLAHRLDRVPGVIATHEGHAGIEKAGEPLLPLVNLENALAYRDPGSARGIVADKRNAELLSTASGRDTLIDVAYYNSTLAEALLEAHPEARMVAIVRDCEGFVRSATTLQGEDPMPVGWPDPAKPLTPRERFIGMGRLKPRPGSAEADHWRGFSAVMKNIWLWRETNLILCQARERFGERVRLLDFALVRQAPAELLATILEHFCAPLPADLAAIATATEEEKAVNRKSGGYQIGPASSWTEEERRFLEEAQALVEERMKTCRT